MYLLLNLFSLKYLLQFQLNYAKSTALTVTKAIKLPLPVFLPSRVRLKGINDQSDKKQLYIITYINA